MTTPAMLGWTRRAMGLIAAIFLAFAAVVMASPALAAPAPSNQGPTDDREAAPTRPMGEDDSADSPRKAAADTAPAAQDLPPPSGLSGPAKLGILGIFVALLGIIGWLLKNNIQMKRQLEKARQAHDDPVRSPKRQALVSEQEKERPRPPYLAAEPATAELPPDAPYTPRAAPETHPAAARPNTPEPHIIGDDDWQPDLPAAAPIPHTRTHDANETPPLPRLTPQAPPMAQDAAAPPPPPEPAPAAPEPSGPMLSIPLEAMQDLVRRAPEMAASEFRAAANALGQWHEVNVNGAGGTLHLGEEDGLPRPLIAILQADGNAVILPSLQYARDFAFQHYKIGNSEPLRAFFDLELSSRTELAYAAPCVVRVEGQALHIGQRGVLSGFSD